VTYKEEENGEEGTLYVRKLASLLREFSGSWIKLSRGGAQGKRLSGGKSKGRVSKRLELVRKAGLKRLCLERQYRKKGKKGKPGRKGRLTHYRTKYCLD